MSEAGFMPGPVVAVVAEVAALTERAARAVGRIDAQGVRGVTGLSQRDIEAMALVLVMLGLEPVPPGGAWPPKRTTDQTDGGCDDD